MAMAIARSWTARATPDGARAYVAFFRDTLAPQLAATAGHRGALVLDRPVAGPADELVEITVHTFWDSLAAIEQFAGARYDHAVVEPEARAILVSFDEHVEHREIALDTR
jgi:hypothetical protein